MHCAQHPTFTSVVFTLSIFAREYLLSVSAMLKLVYFSFLMNLHMIVKGFLNVDRQ
jgi:hypothetical protein